METIASTNSHKLIRQGNELFVSPNMPGKFYAKLYPMGLAFHVLEVIDQMSDFDRSKYIVNSGAVNFGDFAVVYNAEVKYSGNLDFLSK